MRWISHAALAISRSRTLALHPTTLNRLGAAPAIRIRFNSSAAAAVALPPSPPTFIDVNVNVNVDDEMTPPIAQDATAYAQMAGRLHPQLLKGLAQMKYEKMTPVQQQVLSLPTFTQDCLVQAKTGTGKTIAFLLPALHTLITQKSVPRGQVGVLVMAPTRELAQQIADECNKLTAVCKPPLECHIAVGGSNKNALLSRFLNGNPTILVATPGRLNDYLTDPKVRSKFTDIRCVILDEADRMLDQGFKPAIIKILSSMPPKAQSSWQGMCFSATMPPEINSVLHLVLDKNHARISTISENDEPTVSSIPQAVVPVAGVEDVFTALHSLLSCERFDNPNLKAVIFSSTARQAALMYHIFASTGGASPAKLPVYQMHSRMGQGARNRTVEEFKATERGLLFASDVVGRGMDFPDVGLVVQVGLPSDKEQYVHRVGRTGRAGKVGHAVMILTPEEMSFVKKNPEFPIKNTGVIHPKAAAVPSADIIQAALAKIPEQAKMQAYVAFLGFTKTLMKSLNTNSAGIVALANRFSKSMGLSEPPELEPSTVGKMGLKGVPGLNIRGKSSGPRPDTRNVRNPFADTRTANPAPGGNRGQFGGGAGGSRGAKKPLDSSPGPASQTKSPGGEPRRKRPKQETK